MLAPVVAALMCVATCDADAEGMRASATLHVQGGDFPALVLTVPMDQPYGDDGRPARPGCDQVRARRLDELPPAWRAHVAAVQLECDAEVVDDAGELATALTARALLKPARVLMAGLPVVEVRLMDSARWGDHQYIVDAPFAAASPALKQHVEARCHARRMREEGLDVPPDCAMSVAGTGWFLSTDEVSGIWLHPDPENDRRTLYAEAWAD